MEWRPGPQAAKTLRQRVILLAGLPGSGKTTVAGQLQSLGWVWVNQVRLWSSSLCRCFYTGGITLFWAKRGAVALLSS